MAAAPRTAVAGWQGVAWLQEDKIYVATRGAVHAVAFDGSDVWTYLVDVSDAAITAGPAVGRPPTRPNEEPYVFFGTATGMHAIQARVRTSRLLLPPPQWPLPRRHQP